MKTIKLLAVALLFLGLNSCSSDDNDEQKKSELEIITVENLHAPGDVRDYQTGEIIQEGTMKYFSFSQGMAVEETADWDIAFKGTSIIVNGGINGDTDAAATVVNSTFAEVVEAPSDGDFRVDTDIINAIPSGSGNGWYNYNPSNHMITPIAGRILIIRTHDSKYAKVEILSFYKDQTTTPSQEDGAYLTFNYTYQTDGSKNF